MGGVASVQNTPLPKRLSLLFSRLAVAAFISFSVVSACTPTRHRNPAVTATVGQDTTLAARAAFLLRNSPVFDPSRSLEREAAFIAGVRDLLRALNVGLTQLRRMD
jgi:hypothetical protein